MGMRIDQAGYPGLDPAAGTASSGTNTARRSEISSRPAAPQLASVESETPAVDNTVKADAAELENTLEEINKYLTEAGSSLAFIHDEASGRSAVQVLDADGNMIRQIPPQEVLDVYAKIRNIVGILLDENG
jgi:flagellar protein FlaG